MPVHIDEPAPGMEFEPTRFHVRGWLWLEERQAEIAAVELWSEAERLGACPAAELTGREDVAAKYSLPSGTRTAFEFFASHPTIARGEQFVLHLRVRWREGSLGAPIFESRVGPLPLACDPRAMLPARVSPDALGVEIGAHTKPTPGLAPYYTDSVAAYVGTATHVDFLADARALPLADDTLDYLCSSHVLEHLPDPIAALLEWHRVLRPGGWLYLVVPDKRFTFDEPRAVTSVAHLLQDFRDATTARESLEHVDEFVLHTHWHHLRPESDPANRKAEQAAAKEKYLRDIAAGVGVDIHFHTFTPDSLRRMLTASGLIGGNSARFELAAEAERYPPERTDGIALLLRKTGAAAPVRPPTLSTAAISHRDPRVPPLPLVSPVTLEPLRESPHADDRALIAADSGHVYRHEGNCPNLLPPPGATARRRWGTSGARQLAYVMGKLRLAFSAKPTELGAPASPA